MVAYSMSVVYSILMQNQLNMILQLCGESDILLWLFRDCIIFEIVESGLQALCHLLNKILLANKNVSILLWHMYLLPPLIISS